MRIQIYDSYEEMSEAAAQAAAEIIKNKLGSLICPASGDTPSGLFSELVHFVKAGYVNANAVKFVGLDEWQGMNGKDVGSCREYLDRQLFRPLEVNENNICFFDGRAGDSEKECEKTEDFIARHDGIDLCILGLGLNGHIGMNEPGISPDLHSHVATITEETALVGQKYFQDNRKLEKGLTLGIASILSSRQIFLLVSGSKKAEAVKKLTETNVDNHFPASYLKTHANTTVFLDKEAAKLINLP
jgi:galactosamine-6-phosphate isomerase